MRLLLHLGEGKGYCRGIAVGCKSIDPGAAWVAQPQQLGDLVKGLTGCIVQRGAHIAVGKVLSARVRSDTNWCVPAGDYQSASDRA